MLTYPALASGFNPLCGKNRTLWFGFTLKRHFLAREFTEPVFKGISCGTEEQWEYNTHLFHSGSEMKNHRWILLNIPVRQRLGLGKGTSSLDHSGRTISVKGWKGTTSFRFDSKFVTVNWWRVWVRINMSEMKHAVSYEERLRENHTEIEAGGKSKNIMGRKNEKRKWQRAREDNGRQEEKTENILKWKNSETRNETKFVFH